MVKTIILLNNTISKYDEERINNINISKTWQNNRIKLSLLRNYLLFYIVIQYL